jgi:hypothetical protein
MSKNNTPSIVGGLIGLGCIAFGIIGKNPLLIAIGAANIFFAIINFMSET